MLGNSRADCFIVIQITAVKPHLQKETNTVSASLSTLDTEPEENKGTLFNS